MKTIEQMNNLEFKEYYEKEYKSFFEALKEYDCSISIKITNKTIKIKPISKLKNNQLIFDNIELPPNLIIEITRKQRVVIRNYPKESLPDNLKIDNSLKIENSPKLHYFGKNTYVINLFASSSSLKNIKNITVKKSLDLSDTKMIKELPDGLMLDGDCNIHESLIEKIGKNTRIKGCLNAFNSQIIEVSDDLSVLNNFDLSNLSNSNKEIKIGNNIYVGGLFSLRRQKIKKLGENLFAESLDISFSNLENLPSDLQVIDYCNISHTKIKNFPSLFLEKVSTIIINHVFENMDLYYTENGTTKFECFDGKITNKDLLTEEVKNSITFYSNNNPIDQDEQQNVEIYIKNALLYNSTPVQKKLLLERFDTITQNEIKEYLNIKPQIKSNNYRLMSKKKNIIKNKVPLIFYCQSKQAFEFLSKNGYEFNQEEYDIIKEISKDLKKDMIKNFYEVYLIKKDLNNKFNKHINILDGEQKNPPQVKFTRNNTI